MSQVQPISLRIVCGFIDLRTTTLRKHTLMQRPKSSSTTCRILTKYNIVEYSSTVATSFWTTIVREGGKVKAFVGATPISLLYTDISLFTYIKGAGSPVFFIVCLWSLFLKQAQGMYIYVWSITIIFSSSFLLLYVHLFFKKMHKGLVQLSQITISFRVLS